MSAEAINLMNYINPVQDNPAASAMSKNDKDDKSFLKTLDDAQERMSNDVVSKKRADRHPVKNNHEKNKHNEHDPESKNKEPDNAVKNESDEENKETVKVTSPIVGESLLANIDFGEVAEMAPITENSTVGNEPVYRDKAAQAAASTASAEGGKAVDSSLSAAANAGETVVKEIKDAKAAKEAAATIAAKVETEGAAVIKASDKVAAAAKETAVTQTQDMSSKAKEAALANLQSIEGTDTTVVESETSSDTNSGAAFSQGNASEQIIKMSVENAQSVKATGSENFNVHMDKQVQSPSQVQQVKDLNLNKSDIMSQINQKLDEMHQGSSKVTIILKPENLGRIQLEVMNTQDGITAKMLTDNQQVKELLDKNMEALKSQLSAQGVNVNNIKIENAHQASNNAMNFERDQFGQSQSNHSNQNQSQQTSANTGYESEGAFEEFADTDMQHETAETIIRHDGKIDYKV